MAKFTDRNGDEWSLDITIGDIKPVLDATGVDLMSLLEIDVAEIVNADGSKSKRKVQKYFKLISDLPKLIDVVYMLCRDQCQERNLSDHQFGRLFNGEATASMVEAFGEAYRDFLQYPELRAQFQKLLDTTNNLLSKTLQIVFEETSISATELEDKAKELANRMKAQAAAGTISTTNSGQQPE